MGWMDGPGERALAAHLEDLSSGPSSMSDGSQLLVSSGFRGYDTLSGPHQYTHM